MAQRVQVLVTDDLDGSEAATTVRFGLDGTDYEIDLNDDHATQLREVLDTFARAGRKTSKATALRAPRARKPAGEPSSGEVRAWAKNEGLDVSDRGRVSRDLVVKFKAAKV